MPSRPRSDFLRSLGKLFTIFQKVVNRVLAHGGTDADIEKIGKDADLQETLAQIIMGKATVVTCLEQGPYRPARIAELVGQQTISVLAGDQLFRLGQMVKVKEHYAVSTGSVGWIVQIDPNEKTCLKAVFPRSEIKVQPVEFKPSEVEPLPMSGWY